MDIAEKKQLLRTDWGKHLLSLLGLCRTHSSRGMDERTIVGVFVDLMNTAPPWVYRYLGSLPETEKVELLLAAEAYEAAMLAYTHNLSIMFSRSPEGAKLATIAIVEHRIEQSFMSDTSMALAIVGALVEILASLRDDGLVASERNLSRMH